MSRPALDSLPLDLDLEQDAGQDGLLDDLSAPCRLCQRPTLSLSSDLCVEHETDGAS